MAKIAFIGLGNMGGPMAANLVKAGHDLTVFDLYSEAVKALTSEGAKSAATIQEAFVNLAAKVLTSRIRRFGNAFRTNRILWWITIAQRDTGILRPEPRRIVASPTTATGRDYNVTRQRTVRWRQ